MHLHWPPSPLTTATGDDLRSLLDEVRGCRVCADQLDHEPRPVLQAGPGAGVLIVGQAPGRRVHESGTPWDDPSGDRLRDWLGVDRDTFYDPDRIALLPMGFCYPGSGRSGDLPPRPECAPLWHDRVLEHLRNVRVTVLVGAHAQGRYLPERSPTLTETVRRWREHLPTLVLPHPSPRNRHWLTKHPWFEDEVVPALRDLVADALT